MLDRVVAFADGWCPLPEPGLPVRIAELHERAAAAGRSVSVTVLGIPPDPRVLEEHEDAGADRAVFGLLPAPRDEVERQIESLLAATAG